MSGAGGNRAIVAALGANLGIAASKFVAFGFTGSSSMLAEGVHSTAANQVLLLVGGRRAAAPARPDRPFGNGRYRYLYAFLVAIVVFLLGGVFALYEGVEKVRHPAHVESPVWAFAVLGVAVVLEAFSLRTAVREVAPSRGDQSWAQFVRHARAPELLVVVLEDAGALVGLDSVTGAPRFDARSTSSLSGMIPSSGIDRIDSTSSTLSMSPRSARTGS